MRNAAEMLTLQFLAWVSERERTNADVMDVWRSSCPRLTIWEDAVIDGLVRLRPDSAIVELTPKGSRVLANARNRSGAVA